MTRDQQLEFCRRCTHRKFDSQQGIICGLTNKLADFEESCPNFNRDESVNIEKPETQEVENYKVVSSLQESIREKLRDQQDVVYAIVGGAAGAIVGAVLWALITYATNYQIGYMAIAVGFLVGFAVRFFGAGIDAHFGAIGAVFALLGCALGNLLSQVAFLADAESLGYFEVISLLNFNIVLTIYKESFAPMDIFFYAIAAYEGYRFAFRQITEDLIQSASRGNVPPLPYAKLRLPLVIGLFVVLSTLGYLVGKGKNGEMTFYYDTGEKNRTGMFINGLESGEWTYWWPNGNVQYKGFFKAGRQDSTWEYYDETGTRFRTGAFANGMEHGMWTDYYPDGTVSAKGEYVNGRQQGPWYYYYPSGQPSQEGSYDRDLRQGKWTSYYENGLTSLVCTYDKGELRGRWTTWNENGDKQEEINYDEEGNAHFVNVWDENGRQMVREGEGIYTRYFDNGNVQETGMVKNGLRIGLWKYYYEDGKMQSEGEYKGSMYHIINSWSYEGTSQVQKGNGTFTSYYDRTDAIWETGLIKDGLREGEWEMYAYPDSTAADRNGTLFQTSTYSGGVLEGPYKTYFADGSVNVEGNFHNDKREGAWTWYVVAGQKDSEVTYVDGKKEGDQFFYDGKGEVVKIERYTHGELKEQITEGL